MIETQCGRSKTGIRQFPVSFRIEFLREWDDAIERGAKITLMRQHNLDRSTIERWLVARKKGEFTESMIAASEKSRDRVDNRDRAELGRLRKENAALTKKVADAEAAQQILGKAFELLEGITASSTDTEDQIPPALLSAGEYAKWLERHRL